MDMMMAKEAVKRMHGNKSSPHEMGMMGKGRILSRQGETEYMRMPSEFEPQNPFGDVYKHSDKPGAGAKKRKSLKGKSKIHAVMGEFKRKTLRSGSGAKVKKRSQAVAIALSEARKAGAKIPKKG